MQLVEDLEDAHVACADVFGDMLQVVGFGPVEARNLVLGDFNAVLWRGVRQFQSRRSMEGGGRLTVSHVVPGVLSLWSRRPAEDVGGVEIVVKVDIDVLDRFNCGSYRDNIAPLASTEASDRKAQSEELTIHGKLFGAL